MYAEKLQTCLQSALGATIPQPSAYIRECMRVRNIRIHAIAPTRISIYEPTLPVC